jgi:hypothetical protein
MRKHMAQTAIFHRVGRVQERIRPDRRLLLDRSPFGQDEQDLQDIRRKHQVKGWLVVWAAMAID